MHPHSQIPTLGHQLSSEQINSAPPVAPVAVELPDFDSADPEPLGADPEPPRSEKIDIAYANLLPEFELGFIASHRFPPVNVSFSHSNTDDHRS